MRLAVVLSLVFLAASAARAGDPCDLDPAVKDRAGMEAELGRCETIARVATSTEARYEACCRGAAYAFALAEPESDRSSDLARRGVELAERGRADCPDRVEAHYRYALCLGVYLRENKLSALTKVDDLIAAAKRAIAIDERYDRGGPHRLLARLYAEAPRFIGPGDRDLARKHLARLLAIAGDDEENKLTAVHVHSEIGEADEARALLNRVDPERGADESHRRELRVERDRLEKELDDR